MPLVLLALAAGVYYWNNRIPEYRFPSPALPHPNGYDDFSAAAKLATAVERFNPDEGPNPRLAGAARLKQIEVLQTKLGPVFGLIKQGLQKECVVPMFSEDVSTVERHNLRRLLFALDAVTDLKIARGQIAEAVDLRLDMYEMSVLLQRGATFLPASTASLFSNLRQISQLLPKLSHASLRKIASRMDTLEGKRSSFADLVKLEKKSEIEGMARSLRTEASYRTWSGVQARIQFKDELASARDMMDMYNITQQKAKPSPTLNQRWRTLSFLMKNKQKMIEENIAYFDAVAKEAEAPYRSDSVVPLPDNPFAPSWIASARQVTVRDQAQILLVRTQVALREYFLAHRAYSTQLADLVPRYLNAVPADPFGGKPLRYRPLKGGKDYLLYSVFADLQDDGGTPYVRRNPFIKGDKGKQGDLVAGAY